jgi:squalene cyclase
MSDMNNNNIPEEILNELEYLRNKLNKIKQGRKDSINKKPEKYKEYNREYQREYYHSRQAKNPEYMAYQSKKALERYYKKKEEKQLLLNENLVIEK